VSERHALVLVNYGGASGRDIWRLAVAIRDSVAERFGVALEPEPLVV
jgi:UDP-N-acetylmuramate dehydrogenase